MGHMYLFFRDVFTEKKIKKVLETGLNVPHVPHTISRDALTSTVQESGPVPMPVPPKKDALRPD
jgi:hypothetical protein